MRHIIFFLKEGFRCIERKHMSSSHQILAKPTPAPSPSYIPSSLYLLPKTLVPQALTSPRAWRAGGGSRRFSSQSLCPITLSAAPSTLCWEGVSHIVPLKRDGGHLLVPLFPPIPSLVCLSLPNYPLPPALGFQRTLLIPPSLPRPSASSQFRDQGGVAGRAPTPTSPGLPRSQGTSPDLPRTPIYKQPRLLQAVP